MRPPFPTSAAAAVVAAAIVIAAAVVGAAVIAAAAAVIAAAEENDDQDDEPEIVIAVTGIAKHGTFLSPHLSCFVPAILCGGGQRRAVSAALMPSYDACRFCATWMPGASAFYRRR